MNMKQLCPNLKFVGENAKQYEEMEVPPERLEELLKIRERAANFGARIKAVVLAEKNKE